MNKHSKPEESPGSKTNPAGRLRQLQGQYEKRLAAERMAEVTTPALELTVEGFEAAKERIAELEAEMERLRAHVRELEETAETS